MAWNVISVFRSPKLYSFDLVKVHHNQFNCLNDKVKNPLVHDFNE